MDVNKPALIQFSLSANEAMQWSVGVLVAIIVLIVLSQLLAKFLRSSEVKEIKESNEAAIKEYVELKKTIEGLCDSVKGCNINVFRHIETVNTKGDEIKELCTLAAQYTEEYIKVFNETNKLTAETYDNIKEYVLQHGEEHRKEVQEICETYEATAKHVVDHIMQLGAQIERLQLMLKVAGPDDVIAEMFEKLQTAAQQIQNLSQTDLVQQLNTLQQSYEAKAETEFESVSEQDLIDEGLTELDTITIDGLESQQDDDDEYEEKTKFLDDVDLDQVDGGETPEEIDEFLSEAADNHETPEVKEVNKTLQEWDKTIPKEDPSQQETEDWAESDNQDTESKESKE